MVISDIIQYKNKIMDKLISIPDIITLINNPNITPSKPDAIKNVNLFSRIKIPNTITTVKNYICFNFNSRIFPSNKDLKNIIFDIVVVCHEDDINTIYGNRHDTIAGVITENFNWSNFLGFELELVSDTESIWENGYNVRTLQFRNLAPNSLSNGVKMDGY